MNGSQNGVQALPVVRAASEPPSATECLLFAASVLIGYRVEVQVKNGTVFDGVFHAMHFGGAAEPDALHVVLKYAKAVQAPVGQLADRQAVAEKPLPTLVIHAHDLVQVVAKDVKLGTDDFANVGADTFHTDAAIGRGRGGTYGRELEKWLPEGPDNSAAFHLEAGGAGWDQFAVNQALFGVTVSFDEDMYTTNLSHNPSQISAAEAERLAREIEASSGASGAAGIHLAEERNAVVDDSGLDEEDKYSSVLRSRAPAAVSSRGAPRQEPRWRSQPQPLPAWADAPAPARSPLPPGSAVAHSAPRGAWRTSGAGVAALAGRHTAGAGPPPAASHSADSSPQSASPSPPTASLGLSPSQETAPSTHTPASTSLSPDVLVSQKVQQGGGHEAGVSAGVSSSQAASSGAALPLPAEPLSNAAPTAAGLGAETRAQLARFLKVQARGRMLATPPPVDSAKRREEQMNELRYFSSHFKAPTSSGGRSAGPATSATQQDTSSTAEGQNGSSAGAATRGMTASPAATAPGPSSAAAAPIAGQIPKPGPLPPTKPSMLSPSAKAFSLSISAKPFTPGGPSVATPAAAAATVAASSSGGASDAAASLLPKRDRAAAPPLGASAPGGQASDGAFGAPPNTGYPLAAPPPWQQQQPQHQQDVQHGPSQPPGHPAMLKQRMARDQRPLHHQQQHHPSHQHHHLQQQQQQPPPDVALHQAAHAGLMAPAPWMHQHPPPAPQLHGAYPIPPPIMGGPNNSHMVMMMPLPGAFAPPGSHMMGLPHTSMPPGTGPPLQYAPQYAVSTSPRARPQAFHYHPAMPPPGWAPPTPPPGMLHLMPPAPQQQVGPPGGGPAYAERPGAGGVGSPLERSANGSGRMRPLRAQGWGDSGPPQPPPGTPLPHMGGPGDSGHSRGT